VALRTVGGGGEADLDLRAITDEQDIVELEEPDPSPEHGPSDQSGTLLESERREAPNGPRSSPAPPERTVAQESHGNGGLAAQSDEEFDRWASHSARRLRVGVPRHDSPAGTAHLPGEPESRRRKSRKPATVAGGGSPRSRRSAKSHAAETPWRSLQSGRARRAVVVVVLSLVAVSAAAIILDGGGRRTRHPKQPLIAHSGVDTSASALELWTPKRLLSEAAARARASDHQAQHRNGRAGVRRRQAHTATVSVSRSTVSNGSAGSSPHASPAQTHTPTAQPITSSTAPSSTSSGSSAARQASGAQPPFGSNGTLGPGSSPQS
jgi:hypothetical protein